MKTLETLKIMIINLNEELHDLREELDNVKHGQREIVLMTKISDKVDELKRLENLLHQLTKEQK